MQCYGEEKWLGLEQERLNSLMELINLQLELNRQNRGTGVHGPLSDTCETSTQGAFSCWYVYRQCLL